MCCSPRLSSFSFRYFETVNLFIWLTQVAARVSLCLLSVLNIVTLGLSKSTVSLNKSLDLWMLVCLAFVMFAFFEIVLAIFLMYRQAVNKASYRCIDFCHQCSCCSCTRFVPVTLEGIFIPQTTCAVKHSVEAVLTNKNAEKVDRLFSLYSRKSFIVLLVFSSLAQLL